MDPIKNSALSLAFTTRPLARLGINDGVSLRLLLSLAALGLDILLVPALYNGSTLLFTAVLLALAYARSRGRNAVEAPGLPGIARAELLAFVGLHAAIVIAAGLFAGELAALSRAGSFLATLTLSLKLLPLFPALALFPKNQWLRLTRLYRAELIAATLVLFTFFPERQFRLIWPYYSQVIGNIVYLLSFPFLSYAIYLAEADPIVIGPKLIVHIVFECSGIEGITLFDFLFGMVALLSWNQLNKRRLLIGYGIGVAALLLANVLRIVLLIVLGNLFWPTIGEGSFHVHAGWVFFGLVFTVFLYFTYGWMHGRAKTPAS